MHLSKTFFSRSRAAQFAEQLRNTDVENVQVWYDRDGFGQNVYRVTWIIFND